MSAPCPRFGFIVSAAPTQDMNALRRSLVARLSATGLELTTGDDALSIVITREGGQATESDRQLVIGLLNGELDAGAATVSDLVDFNY